MSKGGTVICKEILPLSSSIRTAYLVNSRHVDTPLLSTGAKSLHFRVDSQVDIPSSLARNVDDSYNLKLKIRSILSYPTITRVACIYINLCRPKAARLLQFSLFL